MRYRLKEQGNVSALVQIFNAITSASFSAPAELRMINPNLWTLSSVNPTLKPFLFPVTLGQPQKSNSQLQEAKALTMAVWLDFRGGVF
jgi:hypothetical protein